MGLNKQRVLPILAIGLLGMSFLLSGCNGLSVNNAEVDDINWLVGKWKGDRNGTTLKTTWKQISSQSLNGTTYLINKNDTTGVRALQIETTDDQIILNLRRSADDQGVGYKLAKISGKKAVFKNPEARFPNSITFKKEGKKLKSIWDGENNDKDAENVYNYEKVK